EGNLIGARGDPIPLLLELRVGAQVPLQAHLVAELILLARNDEIVRGDRANESVLVGKWSASVRAVRKGAHEGLLEVDRGAFAIASEPQGAQGVPAAFTILIPYGCVGAGHLLP